MPQQGCNCEYCVGLLFVVVTAEPVFRSRRRRRRRRRPLFPTRWRRPPPSALGLWRRRRRRPGRRRRKRPSLRRRRRFGRRLCRRGLLEAGRAVDVVCGPREGLEHEDLRREERLDRLHGDVQRVQTGGDVLRQGRLPPLLL